MGRLIDEIEKQMQAVVEAARWLRADPADSAELLLADMIEALADRLALLRSSVPRPEDEDCLPATAEERARAQALEREQDPDRIEPAFRAEILDALRKSDELSKLPYSMVGPRVFVAMKGKGVIIIRQQDSLGRRWTNFCELNVSPGIDAVAFASEIVAALSAGAQ